MRGVVRTVLLALLVAVASVAVAQQTHKLSANGVEWEIETIEGGNTCKIRVPQEGRKTIQGKVEIPDKVEIGGESYTVVEIGDFAFYECEKLTEVVIPSSVTAIEKFAFWGCSGLTALTIPGSVTRIGESAFVGCSGLTALTIPGSVTRIEESTFEGCEGLTALTIPGSVTKIGESAFAGCSGLTALTISGSVTSIGKSAFAGCSGLTAVAIPEGVKTIGPFAFTKCSSLKEVTIPGSVQQIGIGVFGYCGALQAFKVAGGDRYREVDGVLFTMNKEELVCYPMGRKGAYTIPDGVTVIRGGAFLGCSGLAAVLIPIGVKRIEEGAFNGCSSLTEVTIPEGVAEIGDAAFAECSSLTKVTIPKGVTKIGAAAFAECSSLTKVTIPKSVSAIGINVLYNCKKLDAVYWLADVSISIDENAFDEISKRATLYVRPGEKAEIGKKEWAKRFENIVEGHVVSFQDDGGDLLGEQLVEPNGKAIALKPAPTKAGFTFVEWQLEGVKYNFDTPVTKDITLVAKWEELLKFKVTFNADGGTPAPEDQLVAKGETAKVPSAPTKAGFTFVEWQLEGAKYDFSAPVTKDITLVAKWEALLKFKVTFNADGGTPAPEEQLVAKGETAKVPSAPTKAGFTFVEWQLEGVKYNFDTPVTKDITLVAKWEKIEEKGPNSHSTAVESALLSGVHAVSNPVGDALVLEGMVSAARVEVYGLRGVQVQAEALHGAGRVEIDARGWTSGVYVIRVVASDGEKTLRVVK